MRFYRQLNPHIPSVGLYGDCYRTCIACLMNLHPLDVPHFTSLYNDDQTLDEAVQVWFAGRGLTMFEAAYNHEGSPEELAEHIAKINGDDFTYMMKGKSITTNHVCIYRAGKLLWDPAGSGGLKGPIDGVYWINILASLRCRVSDDQITEFNRLFVTPDSKFAFSA